MAETNELKRWIFNRFTALLLGILIADGAALWLGFSRSSGEVNAFIIAGIVAGLGVTGLIIWTAVAFNDTLVKPLQRITDELSAGALTEAAPSTKPVSSPQLKGLTNAMNTALSALQTARIERTEEVARETAKLDRQKTLFTALLQDLVDGVLVLTPDNRIMLFNRAAQRLIPKLGLDRPFSYFLREEPLLNASKRINAMSERGHIDTVEFLVATEDGGQFFHMRARPIVMDGAAIGMLLIFHDATEDLSAHADQDHLFNTLFQDVLRQATAVGAAVDAIYDDPEMPPAIRKNFADLMHTNLHQLFSRLDEMCDLHDSTVVRNWPTSTVATIDLFDGLNAKDIARVRMSGKSQFITCDGFAILELFGRLLTGLKESGSRYDFNFAADPRDDQVWLSLAWSGDEATESDIEGWLRGALSNGYGAYEGKDVLLGHLTDLWSEPSGLGYRIVLPLQGAREPGEALHEERAEFYDFDLPPISAEDDMANMPLDDLRYVVFDTETTGLEPSKGDEIIQIAGVRIVNKRILQGDVFDTYVDPKRAIPAVSTEIHGITEDMVVGAPEIAEAGKDFHDFCKGAVLVAHNAPFDMAFLKKKQDQIGIDFNQPVLCTVLLSAALNEFADSHTLDALMERFGLEMPPNMRHTAIGDAMATAQVFIHLLDILKGQGITTLDQAIEATNRMAKYRKAQKY